MSELWAETDHFSPGGVPLDQELTSSACRSAISPDPEVIADRTKRTQKVLRLLS